MVSRSIHSAMMIYSAHKHTHRERQTDTDTQTGFHTQTTHTCCIYSRRSSEHILKWTGKNIQINLWTECSYTYNKYCFSTKYLHHVDIFLLTMLVYSFSLQFLWLLPSPCNFWYIFFSVNLFSYLLLFLLSLFCFFVVL